MAELQVVIESSKAKSGAQKVVRSLNDIKTATRAAEGQLKSTGRAGARSMAVISQRTVAAAKTQGILTAALARNKVLLATMAARRSVFQRLQAGATGMTQRLGNMAKKTRQVSAGFKLMGLAAAAAFAFAIKGSLDFEKTMSRIVGLVGIAKDEVKAFEKPLLAISKATTKGPNELAEALFFITSAGARGTDAIEILEASARAAAAGLGETKTVADAVTSAVNAYGQANLSAAQSTDVLVATVKEGKAEADSIAGAMGRVLPIAQQLGVTFDQVGATVAALTRVGLDANEATTSLRSTLSLINKPGTEAVRTLKALSAANLGTAITFDDVRKTLRDDGLLAALNLLKKATGDNDQELTKIFPNLRANAGVFSLLGKNSKQVAEIFKRMATETGQTDDAFKALTDTNAFLVDKSLNDLRITFKEISDELLPAVATAFKVLASAVSSTIDLFKGLGEAVAEAISGSDDPYIRALDRQKELNDGLADFQVQINRVTRFDPISGKTITEEIRRPLTALDKWIIKQTGINKAGVELSGTYEEQLAQLRKAAQAQNDLVFALDKEKRGQDIINQGLREQADIIEEIIVFTKERSATVIDEATLNDGKEALKELRDETKFLITDLGNLTSLGQQGIGLAEDTALATQIMKDLQGQVELSKDEVINLIRQKRVLEEAISDVTSALAAQDAALGTIEKLGAATDTLVAKFQALQEGGIGAGAAESAAQAKKLFLDLGDAATMTEQEIFNMLETQRLLNTAIAQIEVTPVQQLQQALADTLSTQATLDPESNAFKILGDSALFLRDNILDAQLAALGLSDLDTLMLESLPTEEQFRIASEQLIAAFNARGIVDPEVIQVGLDALEDKIKGTTDVIKEFGIQAARNIQSAFADFLFDPFDEGLEGMLRNFADSLKRMAAEALSNIILKQLFESLANSGGGGIFGAIAGAFADGGDFQGGKPILVGEEGPEIITPRQNGTVIPNGGMKQAPAPIVNVSPAPVVVVDDPRKVGEALQTADGQRSLVDAITQKRGAIKQALS